VTDLRWIASYASDPVSVWVKDLPQFLVTNESTILLTGPPPVPTPCRRLISFIHCCVLSVLSSPPSKSLSRIGFPAPSLSTAFLHYLVVRFSLFPRLVLFWYSKLKVLPRNVDLVVLWSLFFPEKVFFYARETFCGFHVGAGFPL